MKSVWFSYTLTIIFITTAIVLLLSYFQPITSSSDLILQIPLPHILNKKNYPVLESLDIWLPNKKADTQLKNILEITGKSALTYDLTTDQILFEKNPDEKMPMASLTKIMTAIIGLENRRKDDSYIVTKESLVGENTMGLETGEKVNLEELLYGLFLHSGNDAAEVIARDTLRNRNRFLQMMNERAKSLGAIQTHFTNPSGLEGDGEQYTTAFDLLLLTRYGLTQFPLFAQTAATIEKYLPATKNHKEYHLINETNLLTSYPGVRGVKTGYTPEAGYCLVSYLEYDGHKIIAVLLGSENRRNEMKAILDYSLEQLGITPPEHS